MIKIGTYIYPSRTIAEFYNKRFVYATYQGIRDGKIICNIKYKALLPKEELHLPKNISLFMLGEPLTWSQFGLCEYNKPSQLIIID